MKSIKRYLETQVVKDLRNKMVFVGGPRQVGKTTLAKRILGKEQSGYMNWDIPKDRERILEMKLPLSRSWAFDEIHKYRKWRNLIKGLYDQYKGEKSILVTGSARLDFYRFGGDSLQGRYHYFRFHPLSLKELGSGGSLEDLLMLGGFPEPFFGSSEIESKRWSREYRTKLIREDILSLEQLHDLGTVELLMLRLPELVGSPLSVNGLREDLQVSHKTVMRWLDIFERFYAIFRVSPFGSPKIRAVKKEQKHYHFDWTVIKDLPKRFENLVASHLLKWVHFEQDAKGRDIELRYFRDIDLREVDFVIVEDQKPILCVECKWQDQEIGKGLKYFKTRFPDCEAWQISFKGKREYLSKEGIKVVKAQKFLEKLI